MNQELTISPSFINYLDINLPAYRKNDAQECIEIIDTNYIAIDDKDKLWQNYFDELEKVEDFKKRKEFEEIFVNWIHNRKRIFSINSSEDLELVIAKTSNDKIYFNPFSSSSECNKTERKHSGLEAHNAKSLINPAPFHRLKNVPSKIIFEKNVQYDLQKILYPFLRNTKTIEIIDPFLPNPNALSNIKKIFHNLELFNVEVSLVIHSKHNYLNKYNKQDGACNYKLFEDYLNKLKSKCAKVTVIDFEKAKHRDRFLRTDKVSITIPGGFDFLNNDGFADITNEKTDIVQILINYKD